MVFLYKPRIQTYRRFLLLPPLVQTSKLRLNVSGLKKHWELILTTYFTSCHREDKKKCRHTNTQLWFGWKAGCLCSPVCCLEGRGMFLEKAETQWFLSLQWKEGLAKGGVIYFTSVGSGGILGFTCTTFPVYSERKSKVCACEFTGNKTCIWDRQELLIMQVFDVTTVITSPSRWSKVPVFVNVMFFFAGSIMFCTSQPTRWSPSSVTMIWTHQPNAHIHQECCLLPLRWRWHTGTVFSIFDVNHVTKLATKSLTRHEFFMKFTIIWLEKMFYWLLIKI